MSEAVERFAKFLTLSDDMLARAVHLERFRRHGIILAPHRRLRTVLRLAKQYLRSGPLDTF